MSPTYSYRSNGTHQRGMVLAMALVFLLLLTLLGITSMGSSTLEEKMSTNTRDRNLAFNAAETALLAGEAWVGSLTVDPATWPDAAQGRYLKTTNAAPIWETGGLWSSANVVSYPCNPDDTTPNDGASCDDSTRDLIENVATQPKYIIERVEQVSTIPVKWAYRITARGTGSTDGSVVMLQSVYVKQF